MALKFTVSAMIPATPDDIYNAWLDSRKHAAMTGVAAKCSRRVGAKFTAWDGYIEGTNLELEPGKRIVQSWRTSEFAPTDADSRLEVVLAPSARGTKVTLRHSHLPAHGMQYKQGWVDAYFNPMKAYFGR